LVGAEKEAGGDEMRLEEPKIFGEGKREKAGGKGRGQADGSKASEGTGLKPAAPVRGARVGCPLTAERPDEETPVEASKRGLRRVARRERV
jgi:hypothetical protein